MRRRAPALSFVAVIPLPLIPAKAGIQIQPQTCWLDAAPEEPTSEFAIWIPAFAGMSG